MHRRDVPLSQEQGQQIGVGAWDDLACQEHSVMDDAPGRLHSGFHLVQVAGEVKVSPPPQPPGQAQLKQQFGERYKCRPRCTADYDMFGTLQ